VEFNVIYLAVAKLSLAAILFVAGGTEIYSQTQLAPVVAGLPSEELSVHLKNVERYQATHGSPPNVKFYYSAVASSNLTGGDAMSLYSAIVELQRPQISLNDLASLFEAKRDSIHSFRCEYTVSPGLKGTRVYAFSDNKVHLKEPEKDGDGRLISSEKSYDGEMFRSVFYHSNENLTPSGYIARDGILSSLYRPDMPLCRAMLFDMKRTGSMPSLSDLSSYISPACVVYEELVTANEVECLLVSNGAADIYLDISRDFIVMRLDNFQINWTDDDAGKKAIAGRHLTHRTESSDFVDYGNALWLPHEVRFTTFIPGDSFDNSPETADGVSSSTHDSRLISVVNMEVNPELKESLFTDIIPDNAHVLDETRGTSVKISPKSRIAVLFWLNFVAIVVLVGILVMRRMKRASQA